MKRYASIWLPDWSLERIVRRSLHRSACLKPDNSNPLHPFALVAPAQGGIKIMAANRAAQRAGILQDHLLADARALCPILKTADHDPVGDEADLTRLAHWCIRYSPWVADDPGDGILMDITGSAHLFGGEDALARDIGSRLQKFGLTARIAMAKTIGAAWALSHCAQKKRSVIKDDETAAALAPLPVAALRIGNSVAERLEKVGLKTIGALIGKPRAPLAARYGIDLIKRLDQALGQTPESLSPLAEPPDYRTYQRFPEPLLLLDQVQNALKDLSEPLTAMLKEAAYGARVFTLALYRVDGDVKTLPLRTSALCHEADHIVRLFQESLEQLTDSYDAGFGIEQVVLNAYATETVSTEQPDLEGKQAGGTKARFDLLLDRYGNRLGFENIGRFIPRHSHIPERSEQLTPVTAMPALPADWMEFTKHLQGGAYPGRPVFLLPRPEPITAIAEVPDGPPIRFQWRRQTHRVMKAEGPERIAPEWWGQQRQEVEPTRDYFRIEDRDGYRYWLFRQGLYERQETPHWFMHGLFP